MSDRRTITERLEDIAGEICDNICKWAENEESDEDELYSKHCQDCPVSRL